MRLALLLARRDLRRSVRGLLLLALCLFLGTAALAGIGSVSESMLAGLAAQGRTTLGGDLEMRVSQRRATVEEQAAFAEAGRVSETVSLRAMASADGAPDASGAAPTLVDLKAVDARWPLVGRFTVAPGARSQRPSGADAIVAPALADRLGLRVGGVFRVGESRFRVAGLIAAEPDALGEGFSLGPRVIIDAGALDATGLLQPGSLFSSRYRFLLPPARDAEATGEAFAERFPLAGWSSRTAENAASGLRRGIAQLGQFLLLVGLASLAIAGVGVASGVSAYLAGKTRTVATLKVLGARSGLIARIFLLELGLVAGGGALLGLLVGAAAPAILDAVARDALPVAPRVALYPRSLLVAGGLALLVTLAVALPALARARAVPASTLLRDALATPTRPSRRVLGAVALLWLAVGALAVATASDRALAAGFVGVTAAALLGLWALGGLVRWLAARAPRPKRPLPRLALANLHRPGAQTDRLVVALGLGFSLFVALAAIDGSLGAAMTNTAPARAPRFFAADLQPEDAAAFRAAAGRAGAERVETTPSLRGQIVALKGVPVERLGERGQSWVLRGDRTITWSRDVPPRNEVSAGRWWPADYRGPPLVSIEDQAAAELGLKVGDEITVLVLGVEVPARIAALRRVDWSGLGLNFALVFSPGLIEEAPYSFLAGVYGPPGRDGAIARAVSTALPGVTLIRVGDVIGQVGAVLDQIALAIRVAAAATVLAGIAVLVGSVAAANRTRRADAVVLKLVGGTRAQVLGVQALEYLLLAGVLSTVALAVGLSAAWYTVTQVFELPFAPEWATLLATLLVASAVTLGIGLLGTLPALHVRPAEALRDA